MTLCLPGPARPGPGSSTTVGELAFDVPVVTPDTPVAEVDRLFRRNRQLRGVVVRGDTEVALLPRDQLEYELSGPFGYGRSLHARSRVSEVLAPTDLVLPESLSLVEAANRILARGAEHRYQDVLVERAGGYRVVTVSAVFEHLADLFRHVAYHDPLTGLPNRRQIDEAARELTQRGADLSRIAILYIDLDGFKLVNDTFGHRAGDDILVQFAERLRAGLRPGDIVARLGGDEFAVLLVDVSAVQAMASADRIVLGASAAFVLDDQHAVHLSASVGVAMADDARSEAGMSTVDVLLRHADAAMLQAKRSGKRQARRLAADVPAVSIARRAQVRRRLGVALSEPVALALHYQPKLNLATGRTETVEALLRWTDHELGPVSPAEFIAIAEESDQIDRIGRWVTAQAVAQAKRWLDLGEPRAVSINVSPVQLARGRVDADVLAAVAAAGLPAHLLRIEVTEGAAVTDLRGTVAQLGRLRAAGVEVELDDFGVGYSSFALLRDLPLTAVKIDKSFIDRLDTDSTSAPIVRGVIEAAHALGLEVTAEGVERERQLLMLRELGCDWVQGYLIARPAAADALCPVGTYPPLQLAG